MYFNGQATIQHHLHEWWVTEAILPVWRWALRFGDVDDHLKPDFTIIVNDEVRIHGEVDLDTEGYEQVKEQMYKYGEADEPSVWFAPTATRLEGIMRYATPNSSFYLLGEKQWVELWQNAVKARR